MRYSLAHTLLTAINETAIFFVREDVMEINCGDGSKIKRAIPGENIFVISECIASCERCDLWAQKNYKHKLKVGPFTLQWSHPWE